MLQPKLSVSRRTRLTPFSKKLEKNGVKAYTVYNHMLLPTLFKSFEEDYSHLKSAVQVWDVSVQRQIEIKGRDAKALISRLTPRDLTKLDTDRCFYTPMVNHRGRMVNDPVLIKLDEERYWLSIADSDVLFWASGIALGSNLDVEVFEADEHTLAIQGPKSNILMERVFGNVVCDLAFFGLRRVNFNGYSLLISRSGFSKQGGFEIYIEDRSLGLILWDAFFEAGIDLDVRAGCPNLIERIEAGLLSYGNDMTMENSPYECGLGNFCNPDLTPSCVGSNALILESIKGPNKLIRYFDIQGSELPNCITPWPIIKNDNIVGQITSAAYSPDFKTNVAIGMIAKDNWDDKTEVVININEKKHDAFVKTKSFI
jgi:dimethylsulfoniopropionate demethylase